MTLLEWDVDVAEMAVEDITRRLAALNELALWPAFKREFGWTGFHALVHTLQAELDKRTRLLGKAPIE